MDNRCEMRITACFLWIPSWIAEKQETAGRRALRGARGGSRNAFTVGKRAPPGATPGTREEPGDRPLARVPGPGGRRVASAKPASWPAGRGEAGQGPSISYMEGPCLILPGRNVIARTGTPAGAGLPAAMIWGPAEHGRGPQVAAGCAASIRCPPSWAMSSGPRPDPRPACRPPRASTGTLLPASPARERVTGFAVHNHVDHLCKTALGLCAHWGNAGDPVAGPCP